MSAQVAQTPAEDFAETLNERGDVENATANWDGCDVAMVVPDDVDIGAIRDNHAVVGLTDFDAAPYLLIELELRG